MCWTKRKPQIKMWAPATKSRCRFSCLAGSISEVKKGGSYELTKPIYRMVANFQKAAAGKPVTGAAVMAYQSPGEFLRFHPHVHGIVPEGGFGEEGRFCCIPFGSLQHMCEVFRRAPRHRPFSRRVPHPGPPIPDSPEP